jgi:DNA adenine methylase
MSPGLHAGRTWEESSVKTYLPYIGSKASVADYLIGQMPKEASQTYIEPFFGGGSVFFAKTPKARINVLNDYDPNVIGVHQAVAASPEAVMAAMKELPISRLLYEQIQQQRRSSDWLTLSAPQRAARMIYLVKCAINAKLRSTFPASSTTRISFNPDIDLRPYAEFLQRVTFECLPWGALLDRYVLKPKRLSALVYLDPPYVVASQSGHYGLCFDSLEHLLLSRKLARINAKNGGTRSVKLMVSYDDDPKGFIRSLYRPEFGWHVRTLPIQYRSGNHAKATNELLITNFSTGVTQ